MSRKKKDDLKQYENITVADMNVEGMPWYNRQRMTHPEGKLSGQGKPEDGISSGMPDIQEEKLTPGEVRWLIANTVVAALAVGGVFLLAIFLFLLFCVHVWF